MILPETAPPYLSADLFARFGIDPEQSQPSTAKKARRALPDGTSSGAIATADAIYTGERNQVMTSMAGAMRRKGMGHDVIEAALLATNETQVVPPLPNEEVRRIAASVMRYQPSGDSGSIKATLNDVGNASRFVEMHGQSVRYVLGMNRWIIWSDGKWIYDHHGVYVTDLAKFAVASIFTEAQQQNDVDMMKLVARHAANSHMAPRIKAMVDLAARDPRVCIPMTALDSDPMLLGVENGVIDLRTGMLTENSPERLITRYSNVGYDTNARCPTFIAFLTKIFDGDQDVIGFVRRILGYCLTGRTDEQVFFFFFGFGANGKTTLLRVVEALLGREFAKQTPAETLMAKAQGNKQSNDLARLQKVRVVIANEVEDGSLLAESLVKQITGGDTVTARFLFGEFFEFCPEFKLIIAGNHKPVIKSTDLGIWRRTILVDFPVSIPQAERDPDLSRKLESELPGILNWALEGCREWQSGGLRVPPIVVKAVDDYKEEMDWLGQWLLDRCDVTPNYEERAANLYSAYRAWADANGIPVCTATAFGRRLGERGFAKVRRADGQWYLGLCVKKPSQI